MKVNVQQFKDQFGSVWTALEELRADLTINASAREFEAKSFQMFLKRLQALGVIEETN